MIKTATTPGDYEHVRALLRDYGVENAMTPTANARFFEDLIALPGRYVAPLGALFLAYDGDTPAGCAGITPAPALPEASELKRVYVLPAHRGRGLARGLSEAGIAQARALGCAQVVLSTRPRWAHAMALYRALGFVEIAPFKERPEEMPDLLFLGLKL